MAMGIRSTRFYAHHAGVAGTFYMHWHWKGMLTYVQHRGSYPNPYDTPRKQLSGWLEVHYENPRFPVGVGLSLAADAVNTDENNAGVQISLFRQW